MVSSPEAPAGTAAHAEAAPTRREQRTITSQRRILEAAVDCLIEHGFAGATTSAIQARAGVSRGRLLHHFPSREDLLVAAARHLAAERVAATTARAVAEIDGHVTGSTRVTNVVEMMWMSFHEPHFWAAVELWTASRTNEWIAGALLPVERHLGGVIRSSIDRMWGPELVGHPRYAQLREILFTSMRGVALAYAFDHRDPRRDPHLPQWTDTALVLLEV
ncbi:TetR/AcrR family transcriptional regulator [Gordonia sp. ABKF26]|uniref:TetR/AcrR family transcriptional regulator n=1 Tax=Gordonia sp. ABKF26 TaxID=3238687 RepID=UPI0034E53253